MSGVEIDGWSGSVSAELEDLDQLARLTQRSADRVAAVGLRMGTLATAADLVGSAQLCPVTAAQAAAAIVAANLGPSGAVSAAASLEATEVLIAAAATTYRAAERAADTAVAGVHLAGGAVVGGAVTVAAEAGVLSGGLVGAEVLSMFPWLLLSAGPLATEAAATAGGLPWPEVEARLAALATAHPELVQQVAASGGGLVSGAELALPPLLAAAAAHGQGPPLNTSQAALTLAGCYVDGTPRVTRIPLDRTLPDSTALPPADPRQVGDLYAGLAHGIAESGLAGRMTVTTLRRRRADGTEQVRYVVNLPGMDSFSLPGRQSDDARDNSGNLRLIGGVDSAYTRGVAQALALAHVPAGATLALVGHSQGGMAAVQLADDPAFTRRYRVTHVLTAASPVSVLPKNPAVRYLSLENEHDIVPRADGRATAAAPNVLVARFSVDTGNIGGNHDMQLYARTAASLDSAAGSDPDLSAYQESLRSEGYLSAPDGHVGEADVEVRAFRITSDRSGR